jgi:hypothetical protein
VFDVVAGAVLGWKSSRQARTRLLPHPPHGVAHQGDRAARLAKSPRRATRHLDAPSCVDRIPDVEKFICRTTLTYANAACDGSIDRLVDVIDRAVATAGLGWPSV